MQDSSIAIAPNEFEINGIARGHSHGYTSAIKRYDLLEEEQEQQLARRWQDLGDHAAADALVTSHLRLAASVARRYKRYGLPLADITSEASLGLVLAALRFKCDVLWTQLDALYLAYVDPAMIPPGAFVPE